MTDQPSDVAANVKIANTASPPTSESKKHHYSSSKKMVIAKNSTAQKFFEAFIEHLKNDHSQPKNKKTSSTESDRKSTRLNSSHVSISYAVFCLKKKKH